MKVTLYTRSHSTRQYQKAKSKAYPMGTIFVLRYGAKWETLCRKWILHTVRKTWATFQSRSGADVRTIQQDLGHSSLVTTLNYLAAEDRRSAVRRAQINAADARVRQHTVPCRGMEEK
jgi:integrase